MANHELPLLACNSWILIADHNFRLINFSHWPLVYSLGADNAENITFISFFVVACRFVSAETCVQRRCLAVTASCSTISSLSHHVTMCMSGCISYSLFQLLKLHWIFTPLDATVTLYFLISELLMMTYKLEMTLLSHNLGLWSDLWWSNLLTKLESYVECKVTLWLWKKLL